MAQDKAELRKAMRARRVRLARGSPDAARAAAEHLPEPIVGRARVVGGYRAQGSEMDPGPPLARFAAAGARIVLPVAVAADGPLAFRLWREGDPLAPDALGIPAPAAGQEEAAPDLLIVPVLAFDRAGWRLGQGAGCFDRTLAALRARGPLTAIGLAFAGQEVDRLPREAHDEPLDAILTEEGFLAISPAIRRRS